MKGFLKTVLAVIVGGIILGLVTFSFSIAALIGIAASAETRQPVEKGSVLRISLNGTLQEQYEEDPLASLTGDVANESMGLDQLLSAIYEAKKNDKIKGIYLEGGSLETTPAMAQELRQALKSFKDGKKFIYAHADQYSGLAYYVCSVADELTVNPIGGVDWHGLASTPMFFKDVMDKLGVKAQVFKVGTYKSAVEPYTSTQMSEANREQVTAFLGSIWNQMLTEVSQSRKVDAETLNAVADSFPMLHPTRKSQEWKLVDGLAYTDQAKAKLQKLLKLKKDEKIKFVSPKDLVAAITPSTEKNQVAVYYAWGDIVTEPAQNLLTGGAGHSIVGGTVANDLRKLREDENVKAVVLRVNSGGGSVFASEEIWREMVLLRKAKPVVVSMGGMAASGGYYISAPANKIYAEPTTLTGSIGVFGIIPDASKLLTEKIGLKFDLVKTNRHADFGSMGRAMNESEQALMQRNVEETYTQFIRRVVDGRKLPEAKVRQIAEGRVWTGEQAKQLGLVDQLGSLQDAVKDAAKLAKIKKYSTAGYPKALPWYMEMLNKQKEGYMESKLRQVMGENYEAVSALSVLNSQDRIQARIPFLPNIR
ncbi:MAG: signal peptide peptidase SppA [Prevotellaceae bacterium]|nr:signal peptide peptidase SppA [Prevotellaceae bacterium]